MAENAALRASVADLTVRLEWALARIGELEARLKQSSSNSSKPASSDGLAKPAPKSLRGRSGRRPGRPAGGDGVTLAQVADPDVVVRHEPAVCAGCGDSLAGAAEVGVARRQVFDIPEPKLQVTEHQIVTRACACGTTPLARRRPRPPRPRCTGRAWPGSGCTCCTGSSCPCRAPRRRCGTCSAPRWPPARWPAESNAARWASSRKSCPSCGIASPPRRWPTSTRPGCAPTGAWPGYTPPPHPRMCC
ncbi:IS66 family transposase zinc-finger binding domain-containing protein [Micromonospora sp. ATA32]|nr:IS66 family transposase zinc-finger binding domain-containing protein [Micromonospora sp. ATA32]